MRKGNPSSGQNGQLVHWWLLIHSGPEIGIGNWPPARISPRTRTSLKTHFMQVFSSSFFEENILKHLWFILYT
jgi:hypothetical protein